MTKSGATLGILGDGQLALMLGESARAQGFAFKAFGESSDSSFARAFPENFVLGSPEKLDELISFAKQCSVLTLENEFIPADVLEAVSKASGTAIVPNIESYRHFESKLAQRKFYADAGIASPKWAEGKGADASGANSALLEQLSKDFKYPVVLKASRGGYDGYGVRIVKTADEVAKALVDLKTTATNPVLIEEKVSMRAEFAQGAVFDGKGNAVLLPLVETVQRDGICELVLSRSSLPSEEFASVQKAVANAFQKLSASGLMGLFSFEFFLTTDGRVLINEGAPRPHNSQHLSIDASPISQFDLLVSFLGRGTLPPVASPVESKPGVMINLLGKSTGPDYQLGLPKLPSDVSAHPKLYLKKESRVGRKMGHLNLVDPSGKHDLVELARTVLKEYTL